MNIDFLTIYNSLNFLSESIRLQYSNFILKHQNRFNQYLSFDDVISRVRVEEPIEYVFNLAEFCGNEFYVDKRCLIPRPETEEIVRRTEEFIKQNPKQSCTVIDVGTGSGCIILSLAKKFDQKQYKFIGIDISPDALEIAEINRKAFNLENRVELINESFQEFDFTKYENIIICSNLPYIPDNEKLQKSVIDFEPHLALFGGENGDELNNILIEKLKKQKNIKLVLMEGHNGEIKRF